MTPKKDVSMEGTMNPLLRGSFYLIISLLTFVLPASAVDCFPSAAAVMRDRPQARPTWTMKAPGHEGTMCWYASPSKPNTDHPNVTARSRSTSETSEAAGSPVTGQETAATWSGKVVRVQEAMEYAVILKIDSRGGLIKYPELDCEGTLVRIGASFGYIFFVQNITRGSGSNLCSRGAITVIRSGDKLAWVWFGIVNGETDAALGALTRTNDVIQGEATRGQGHP